MLIIGLTATNGIDAEIAGILNVKYARVQHKVFPDGESYVRFPVDVSGEDVVLVQTTFPMQDKRLLELLLAVDAAVDLGASSVHLVVPYLAYARQDKRFLPGEAISVKTILKTLRALGASSFVTVDIHKEDSLKFFSGKAVNISAVPALAEEVLRSYKLVKPLVLAPDLGALGRAKELADILNCDYDYLEKHRDRVTGEITVKPKEFNVAGRDVIIVDDIISTGGTIAKAAHSALRQGARMVVALCTHALLVGNALARLREAGVREVIATNTVASPVKTVSVAPLLAKVVREVVEGAG